jgi:signal transduction histidine kinase
MISGMAGPPSIAQIILDQLKEFKDESRNSMKNMREDLKEDIKEVREDVREVKLELTKEDGVLDRLAVLESRESTPISVYTSPAKKTTKEKVVSHSTTAGVVGLMYAIIELLKPWLSTK